MKSTIILRKTYFFYENAMMFERMLNEFKHNLIWGDSVKVFRNKTCLKWIVISELIGILSGLLSMKGMVFFNENYQNAPLTPPGWLFAVVWTILYGLMGIGACLVSNQESNGKNSCCLNLFIAQLIVNFFWPLIFFNALAFFGALVWILILLALVIVMTVCFSKINRTAAWLQVPYMVWLSFAVYLNAAVWLLNV